MIWRSILPILGICTLVLTDVPLFQSDVTIQGMVRDSRGHMYLGGVNTLYQLDPDFNVLNKTITGPVQDHPKCCPPQLDVFMGGPFCFDGAERETTDNYNQLILIDEVGENLITCGNVYQGTCEARPLSDITFALPQSESFMPESYVVSTNKDVKSVGFIATTGDNLQSLYVASYLSPTGEFLPEHDRKPALANRHLIKPDTSFAFYVDNKVNFYRQISWHKKESVSVTFVAGFSADNFAYFFFHEQGEQETESRVARMCLSDKGNTNSPIADSTYTSYIELPLRCAYDNQPYPALSGLTLESVPGFFEGDKRVLAGTFSNEKNKTAICAFSFDEINRRFNDKVKSCSLGQGVRKIKSESEQPSCVKSKGQCEDVCTCNVPDANYPLEADTAYSVDGSVALLGGVSALATNVVKDQVEMFLGVQDKGLYSVMKVVLESPDRSHFINEYPSESTASKIIQLLVLPDQDGVLVLREKSIKKLPISVCTQYVDAGCDKCLMAKDPHCGWCEMSGTCTTEDTCTTDLWRTSGSCTTVTSVLPNTQAMSKQRVNNKVSIATNYKYPVGTPLQCDFGKYGSKPATVEQDGNITCKIPYVNPVLEGKHVIDITIVSGDVTLATAEKGFTFFNCDSYKTCAGCTGAAVGCGWCIYANSCSQVCYRTTLPQQCPALTYSRSYVPADFPHRVEITGVNLPKPLNDDGKSYQCHIDVEGKITTLKGLYVNESAVVCATNYTFRTNPGSGQSVASVKVIWEGQEVEAEQRPQLEIYRCSVLGKDCSSCRSHSTIKACGWCEEKGACLLQYGGYEVCPKSYSQVCVGLSIESFEPKHGPLEGGTLVKIAGTNLGSSPADITSVKIAGLDCDVQTEGFEVSRAVVCRTSPSLTVKHGMVEVTTSGDKYIFPDNMFNYKDYKVSTFLPTCGIAAGGNTLQITGQDLNTGSEVSVRVAGAMCDIQSTPSSRQVECVTKEGQVGSHRIQVSIDGGHKYSEKEYKVVPNPVSLTLPSTRSIQSGGIPITIPFTAHSQLDCVHKLQIIFQTLSRQNGYGDCKRSGESSFRCLTPALASLTEPVSIVQAHLKADNLLTALEQFTIYADPVLQPFNTTNEEGYYEWPMDDNGRKLVLNGQNLSRVPGIEVYVADFRVDIQVTDDHIVLTPPNFADLQQWREKGRKAAEGKKVRRDTDDTAPDKRSNKVSSEYVATVRVKLGGWEFEAGKLYYTSVPGGGVPYVAIIIPIGGFIVLVVLLTYVGMKYHSSKRSHRRTLKTVRMHMERLEMRVANECKDAFTALQTHLTDMHGSVADVPFRPFSDFMANVLFPGTEAETRDLLARLSAPMYKTVETQQVSQFRRLLMDKAFLQRFVEVVEADQHFDVTNKCKMASLLVIAISDDMKYLTEVLFVLMEKLIDKFLAKKNHPQLLLRRTESVADKLLTHWLNYCCFDYLTKHAGKSIFTLFSAIKQQLDLGPQDQITYEAKSSLNNEKMLRETIEFSLISGTVRDLDKTEHSLTLLTCDSVRQAKRKVLESVHRHKPASQMPPLDSFDLMYIRGNLPTTLREIDKAPIVEGWRKLNTLSDYKMEDGFTLQMVPLSTDSEHSSISPQADRRKASFLTSKRYRSKGNLINTGVSSDTDREEPHQLYHLIKPSHDICETDTLLSTKMMSEVFLTRLLSTKGTLQPYVDDLFNSVFMPRDKVPPCIKYLFDFLERQAHRHNVGHNQNYIHTWKNNSLSLRFWMNVLKNPHFLLDIVQTPTIDSSLNIVCGVFMDSCSTSDKGLNKDSPINKLLYAKDIPKYKKQVQLHYEQVSKLPPPTADFLTNLPGTGLNTTVAVSELLKIAQKYQKQLQTSFISHSPSLNLKFSSIVDPSILNTQNMV